MNGWILRFAWRDSRGSRKRMLLFVSSMVLGVAALVAINSFGYNLRAAIDAESQTLLGADMSFESDNPFPPEIESLIDSLGGEQSRRTSFSSMAYFPKTNDARLATVRAHEPGYPWYGEIVSEPADAANHYLDEGGALVDGTLMQQFRIDIGDSLRIGNQTLPVTGRLIQTPRESEAIMLFSPRIYIPMARLDTTLFGLGSRVNYEVYFKWNDGRDVEALDDSLRARLRAAHVSTDTVQEERRDWDRSLTNMYRFLGLVGFMALLLGSLGVASSIHVYVRQRIQTVAVLRCFGARSWATFRVYLLQAGAMGLVGALVGSLVGVGVQKALPGILGDFLPVDVDFRVSWSAVLLGSGIGLGVTLLFALLPLIAVRRISPLSALRSGYGSDERPRRDGLWWGGVLLLAIGLTSFAVIQAPSTEFGIWYALGLGVVFLLLAGTARLLMVIFGRHTPRAAPYVIRQGIANLHRPNNQTLMMMLALGLGTFLIVTMLVSQMVLMNQINLVTDANRPNLVFYDVQPGQVSDIESILDREGLDVMEEVPMITMRIASVKGRTVQELRADSTIRTGWAHRREYRSTYRDHLSDSETLVDGEFTGNYDGSGPIPVSAEEDITRQLGVGIGDSLAFNVQGVDIPAVIGSIRTVDWRRMQTNFFFVFPAGSLEEAPAFHVMMTRANNDEASGTAQAAVIRQYPNVSSIDISLVLSVFESIFSRISFVIRFMALFSILTGLIVLSGAVLVSRFQRIEESVLLKTLGASKRTVLRIMSVEYAVLGLVAALTGVILALGAGWALSHFVFEADFKIDPLPLLAVVGSVVFLTLLIGHLNSRGVYERSALEVLRSEV